MRLISLDGIANGQDVGGPFGAIKEHFSSLLLVYCSVKIIFIFDYRLKQTKNIRMFMFAT